MLRIGLTGGIASGKTTVARLFAALGIPVIDSDELAREVVAPGTAGLVAIRARFGPGVIQPDGSLDRRALRQIVFDDEVDTATPEPMPDTDGVQNAESVSGSAEATTPIAEPLSVSTSPSIEETPCV